MSKKLRFLLPVLLAVAGVLAAWLRRDVWGLVAGLALAGVGGWLARRDRRQDEAVASRLDEVASRLRDDRESHSLQMVVPIQWTSRMECGHPLIDEQHRRLFEMGGAPDPIGPKKPESPYD